MKAFMGDQIRLMLQTKEGQRKLREFMLGKDRISDSRAPSEDEEEEKSEKKPSSEKSNNAPELGM